MWFGAVGRIRFEVLLIFFIVLKVYGVDKFSMIPSSINMNCGGKTITSEILIKFAKEGCWLVIESIENPAPRPFSSAWFLIKNKAVAPEPYGNGRSDKNDQLYQLNIKPKNPIQSSRYAVIYSWNSYDDECRMEGAVYSPGSGRETLPCVPV